MKKLLLFIPIFFTICAADNFDQIGKLNKSIDAAKKINESLPDNYKTDISSFKSEKTKRTILGISYSVVAVINLFYALEKVTIRTNQHGVTLSYNF